MLYIDKSNELCSLLKLPVTLKNIIISILIFTLFIFCNQVIEAQTYTVRGKLISTSDNKPLIGATFTLVNVLDSVRVIGGSTDENGDFELAGLLAARYRFKAFYMGHKTYIYTFMITNKNVDLKEIKLEYNPITLKNVNVVSNDLRTIQKSDTTVYNARAYKTNPDANTEDLIKKMPGIVVQDGKVQAHGEDLKKVLVDGQEFFGDDATIALKNIPAEVIDKIQVFDKQSDQSLFTGFNDGNTEKTINIVTKTGKNNGQFGKIYAGYGTTDRYIGGGSINFFNGTQRISLIGLSNNVNQQNFSNDDIMGVLGTTSQRQGGGQPGKGGPPSRRGGSGDAGNFMVGQQNGINTTNSYGLNYSNKWKDKATLNASYFFNNSKNNTESKINRQYFVNDSTSQFYKENYTSSNNNYNNRFNAKFEYKLDSMNSLIITPRLSIQNNKSQSVFGSNTKLSELVTLNNNSSNNSSSGSGYNISNNILLKHKFVKTGRTISLNFGNSYNNRNSVSKQNSVNDYYTKPDTTITTIQQKNSKSESQGYSGSLIYTEPLGKKANLQLSYSPSYSVSNAEKLNYTPDNLTGAFIIRETNLSNKYNFRVLKQSGGVNYRLREEKYNFMTGVNLQEQDLTGDQEFPLVFKTDKKFTSLLPTASLMYNFTKAKNLRIFYRTSTRTPDISQLQDVVDNSNPVLLSTGNSALDQEYSHNLSFNYHSNNATRATSFFVMMNTTLTNNRITNSTIIPKADMMINNFTVAKGNQITMPVNINGYKSLNSFFTFGFPVNLIKSNLNFNGGLTYAYSPGLINNAKNISETYTARGGVFIGSNISENIDFGIAYNMNYYFVNNTISSAADNNYINQTASARILLLPWKGLVLSTDISYSKYSGLASSYNQELLIWNAGIGYKFLKNKQGELRISVSDLLHQNKSINRFVTETYIEDNETTVLSRYFILTFTYNLKNFYAKK